MIHMLRLRTLQTSIYSIIRHVRNGFLILAGHDGRDCKWNNSALESFITSALIGLPLCPIYLFEHASGKRSIIDGLERVNAIVLFANDKIEAFDKTFSRLPAQHMNRFEDVKISSHTLEHPASTRTADDIRKRMHKV